MTPARLHIAAPRPGHPALHSAAERLRVLLQTLPGNVKNLFGILSVAAALLAAPATPPFPFAKYPAEVFHGKPELPQLNTPNARRYRTRIRQGAAKGPNFAGHYTIVEWGCGTCCMLFSVVDARTGKVYDPPFASSEGLCPCEWGATYRVDSALLVVQGGGPNGENCTTRYYRWNGSEFVLLDSHPVREDERARR